MKRRWLFLLIVAAILIVLLAVGLIWQRSSYAQLRKDYQMLDKTYSSEFLHLNSITLTRFYRMLETDEDYIVYIGRPDCGTCRTYETELLEIVERLGLTEEIYFLSVSKLHEDAEAWAVFKRTYDIGGTPSFVHIQDGRLVSSAGWTEQNGISMGEIESWLQTQR